MSTPVDLINIGNSLDTNLIKNDIVDQYIVWADEEINSTLSQLYSTPFCEKADFETCLLANIDDYNDLLTTAKACPFSVGDEVVLTDGTNEERHIIDSIVDDIDNNIFETLEPIGFAFDADSTRVIRVKFPEPITLISSMLAASRIYDKYFASQSDPNVSEYGKYLRRQARVTLNNILNGRNILHGAQRIGRRFYNPNLSEQYDLPKGSEGGKDIDSFD